MVEQICDVGVEREEVVPGFLDHQIPQDVDLGDLFVREGVVSSLLLKTIARLTITYTETGAACLDSEVAAP